MRCEQCDFKASRTEELEEHIESFHITQATIIITKTSMFHPKLGLLSQYSFQVGLGKSTIRYYNKHEKYIRANSELHKNNLLNTSAS